MTKLKRFASMAAATALAVSMVATTSAVSAFASDAATGTATTSVTVTSSSSHSYSFYQVFSGTISSGTLTSIEWGSGVSDTALLLAALKADTTVGSALANCTTAGEVATVLSSQTDDSSFMQAFAAVVADYLGSSASYTITGGTSGDVADGYYLIKDDTTKTVDDGFTRYILELVGDVDENESETIEVKSSAPTVTKKVQENETSLQTTNDGYNDWADYCIGDAVPFKLTGTLPSTYADYDYYTYTFNDTLCAGLSGTAMNDTTAKTAVAKGGLGLTVSVVNGTESIDVTSSFRATLTADGKLTVTCADLKSITGVTIDTIDKDSKIVVNYSATLDTDAEIGLDGNVNEVCLTYSNNPNYTGDGDNKETNTTGNTPVDTVIVFTYEVDVTKVDASNNDTAMKNVVFKLKNADDKYVTVNDENKVTGWADSEEGGSSLKTDEDGKISVIGLDDGTYTLVETTPAGYNKIDDIVFEVDASMTAEDSRTLLDADDTSRDGYLNTTYGDAASVLKALKINITSGGDAVSEYSETNTSITGNTTTGAIAMTVENTKGSSLPGTGGMGTTLFYVCGGTLAVGAAVLLVTKKRAKDKAE